MEFNRYAGPDMTSTLVAESEPEFVTTSRCTAHARTGLQCGKYAIPGGTVCHIHGGNAPQVRAAALSRLTEVRDLALDRLLESLAPPESSMFAVEVKDLLAVVDKLTTKVQLLSGEATTREETIQVDEVRLRLDERLAQLAQRVQINEEIIDIKEVADVEEEE